MLCASEIYVYTLQLRELFPTIFKFPSKKKEILFLCDNSQSSTAKTRNIFPESRVWLIRRKLELPARCKTFSENTFFDLYSEFYSVARTFRRSLPKCLLTLSCFSISVTMSWECTSCVPWLRKRVSCFPRCLFMFISCVSSCQPHADKLHPVVNKEVSVAFQGVCSCLSVASRVVNTTLTHTKPHK
jgi:hypothetical protein